MGSFLKKAGSFAFGFFHLVIFTRAQVNLVPNPGFEQLDSCTATFQSQFTYPYPPIQVATPWDTLKNGGGAAGLFLCNRCFNPNSESGVPVNISSAGGCTSSGSYQQPHSGDGYLFLLYFKKNTPSVSWRGYAQAKLTSTLIAGKEYCVTYYASLSNRENLAIDELSAYFDDGSIQSIAPRFEALASPQIKSPTGVFYIDTLSWMKVQGTFTASGTESYITLGNFRTSAATNYSLFCGTDGIAEYYVDDVSVIPLDLVAYAGLDQTILLGDSAFVGRPPEIGLECTWTTGTTTVGTGAGLWVKPTVTTTYVVTQDVCGMIKTDIVTVTVLYVGINEIDFYSQNIKLYPQPAQDILNIELNFNAIEKFNKATIYDNLGQMIREEDITFTDNNAIVSIKNLAEGIYFITINNQNHERITKKLVITH